MEHLNHTPSRELWWSSCILLILLATMHSCSSSAAIYLGNETDRMALLDIKLQMNDPNGFLNPWNDSQHQCQWPGVTCETLHQRVTALTLRGKALSGTISSHVGNLTFLRGIHLGENSLHGEIPQQIGQLSKLRFFNLSNNLLSGEIPVNLSKCSHLTYIDLVRNNLTGKIPAEIAFLTKLELLRCSSNNLTGRIPDSLGNMSSSLIELGLDYNNLEGYVPNELGLLSRLIFLGFGANRLIGEIPSSLFNISALKVFSATANLFSSKLPINLGLNLPNVQRLEIGGNNLFGEIPISITNCTNLKLLDLSSNQFVGKVPTSVGQLVNLQSLNVETNSLSGDLVNFLVPLTNCTNLSMLSISMNNFSGELPNTIGNLSSQLTFMYFAVNKITGSIPMELGNLARLEIISLEDNYLTGVMPMNLAKLQNLRVLVLAGNSLSGYIPHALCSNLTYLNVLLLKENDLRGDLSHSLGNCRILEGLNVGRNKFSGIIPSHIFGSYLSPSWLVISSNSLTGTLPLEIGKLINIRWLNASHNKLSGHIPSTISGCLVITTLDLRKNHFSGPLPPSLASMKGIEYLDLSDNTLTGPIPSGINQLVYLNYLNLSYNDLEGKVPIDGVFANATQIMLQGNKKLCGGIAELGLSPCPVLVQEEPKEGKHMKIVLIPLLVAFVISITLFLYLFLRGRGNIVRTIMSSTPSEEMLRVSYHDLYRATNEFSPANLIGSGSFGFVYKCRLVLEHGEIKIVAIKVLVLQRRGASKSFKAECRALSNLRHRNIVPLLTYCSSVDYKGAEFKALVYKYMENGSLDTWLHPDLPLESPRCLSFLQRLNIAIDVALALDYLHNDSHVMVAHCDVKPSNILLDNEFTAYVGDFGLARLFIQLQQEASSSTIAIKGTIGYAAPEYAMGLEVSTQGDVYSYGILLLEMFTGKRPTNDAFTEGLDLCNYVKMGLCDQVWKIVDPLLLSGEAQVETGFEAQECLISILELGLGCSQGLAKDRMDMKQVMRELHSIRDAIRIGRYTK